MDNIWFLNLTYKGPAEDLSESLGFNVDGTVNIKFSLLEWAKCMEHNLMLIQKISHFSDKIEYISPLPDGLIEIKFRECLDDSELVLNQVIIRDNIDINEYDIPEETNQERLKCINNITATDPHNLEQSSDSDVDTIGDRGSIAYLKNKLVSLASHKIPFSDSSSSDD